MSIDYFNCLYDYLNFDLDEDETLRFYNSLISLLIEPNSIFIFI